MDAGSQAARLGPEASRSAANPPHPSRRDQASADAAFGEALCALMPRLRRAAISFTANDEADDLVQEALLKAWSMRGRLREPAALDGWVNAIVRNASFSRIKRRRYAASQLARYPFGTYREPAQEWAFGLLQTCRRIERLPSEQREAFLAVAINEESYETVAARLGCPTGTVKSRVARARRALAA